MKLYLLALCSEDSGHHIHIAVVIFITLSLIVDYLYMETLLPKITKQHKSAAFFLTLIGYVCTEVVRAIPELAESFPKELANVDFNQLHELIKLLVN